MQPLSGNQRPDLLTALMNLSLVLRLPRKMHGSSSKIPRLPSFLEMLQNLHVLLTFDKIAIPRACHAKRHLNVKKVLRTPQFFFALLTSKCASRHNSANFFDISTSKTGPKMVCFAHFDFGMCFAPQQCALFRHLNFLKCPKLRGFVHVDFEMCFAPQRRALFRHLNFKKCSELGVLCAF